MSAKTLNDENGSFDRWAGFKPVKGTLRELKEESATIKEQIKKERKIFSIYSLFDGGKKLDHS